MSIRVSKLVRRARLPKGHKAVLLAMADYASDDGTRIFPGTARLARDTGYTERWIRSLRRDLLEWGLIHETRPSSPTTPAHYTIDLQVVENLSADGRPSTSPPVAASPPEFNAHHPLNSLPSPPVSTSPKPSENPSQEPSSDGDDWVDEEVERRFREANARGTEITNEAAWRAKVRKNVLKQRADNRPQEAEAKRELAAIAACRMCAPNGMIAWELDHGSVEAARCTHNPADYEHLNVITRGLEGED